MPDANPKLELRLIQPGDKLTGLSIGDSKYLALKIFLQKQAKSLHDANLARTYGIFSVTCSASKLIAYITLVCGEISTQSPLLPEGISYGYPSYPAIKIARLAVDSRYRDQDVGTNLVDFSLGLAKTEICPAVGCRFVVVDAKTDAIGFYTRRGFTMLDTEDNKKRESPVMFVDLWKAAKAAEDSPPEAL